MHSALHLLSDPYRTIFRLPSFTFEEQLDLAVFYAKCQVHENVEVHAVNAKHYFRLQDEKREFLFNLQMFGVKINNPVRR